MDTLQTAYRIICLAIIALLQTSRCLTRTIATKPPGSRALIISDSLIAAVIILGTPFLIP